MKRPGPGDTWGVWVEYRLKRLEDGQRRLIRFVLGALLAQIGLEVIRTLGGG